MSDPMSVVLAAEDLADEAAALRASLRGEDPEDPDRLRAISQMLDRIRAAMRPIRQMVGRLPYTEALTLDEEDRLRAISKRLQYERRQLVKMDRPRPLI